MVDFLIRRQRVHSSQVLSHQGEAQIVKIQRSSQGVSGWREKIRTHA
jgi:hypothetical protein